MSLILKLCRLDGLRRVQNTPNYPEGDKLPTEDSEMLHCFVLIQKRVERSPSFYGVIFDTTAVRVSVQAVLSAHQHLG